MLIGVVGLNGSGKDTIARYLVEKHGFSQRDFGAKIRDELKKLGRNHLDRDEMVLLANERRSKFGPNYWAKRLLRGYTPSKKLVLTSVRNPAEVDEIRSRGGIIVEVFASAETRYKRTVERVKNSPAEHGDVSSFEEFKMKDEREMKGADPTKQQLLACISAADHRLDNNGSVEKLGKEIEDLLRKLGKKKK
jgi:dephospho-CoA kinase